MGTHHPARGVPALHRTCAADAIRPANVAARDGVVPVRSRLARGGVNMDLACQADTLKTSIEDELSHNRVERFAGLFAQKRDDACCFLADGTSARAASSLHPRSSRHLRLWRRGHRMWPCRLAKWVYPNCRRSAPARVVRCSTQWWTCVNLASDGVASRHLDGTVTVVPKCPRRPRLWVVWFFIRYGRSSLLLTCGPPHAPDAAAVDSPHRIWRILVAFGGSSRGPVSLRLVVVGAGASPPDTGRAPLRQRLATHVCNSLVQPRADTIPPSDLGTLVAEGPKGRLLIHGAGSVVPLLRLGLGSASRRVRRTIA